MAKGTFTFITEETLIGAKNRALAKLNELTGNKAEEAIKCVSEYVELDSILQEHQKNKAQAHTDRKKWR